MEEKPLELMTKSRLYGLMTAAIRDMQNFSFTCKDAKTHRKVKIDIKWEEEETMTDKDGVKWKRVN